MTMANSLQVEESMYVGFEEWKKTGFKTPPALLIGSSAFQRRALIFGKRFSSCKTARGWVITRKA
jgi:hypothetical protein